MDADFPDFPELPDEPEEAKTCNECDVYSFYNKLQSPWQNLFIDIRNSNKFKQTHPRYSINIPIQTSTDDIFNILKNDINAQQNIILKMYIYTDTDNNETKEHYSVISAILKDKFTLFPQMFVFNDKNALFVTKYPFLCENDEEKKSIDDEKKTKGTKHKYQQLLQAMATKQQNNYKKKSFVQLYSERIGYHLEYPDQILNDRLFLGDYNAATRREILQNLGISHIVNCTQIKNEFEKDKELNIKYFQVPVLDEDHEPIALYFDKVIEFIDNAMKESKDNKVFIHCRAGVSRSATITVSYLMKINAMSMDVALQYVEEKRGCVDPNGGFRLQLKHFQKYGYKINIKMLKKELETFGEELYV